MAGKTHNNSEAFSFQTNKETKVVENVDRNMDKNSAKKTDESYVKMKPKKFLVGEKKNNKYSKKTTKEKWLKFNM